MEAMVKSVSHVRENRKFFDRLVLWIFKAVFLRWCDKHLNVAYQNLDLNSEQLHNLDAQMKADLGYHGFGL